MAAQQAQAFRWHYDDLDDKNFHVHGGALLNLILLISVSVLLSSTLLCLLVRWAYRHSRRTAETGSVSMAPAAGLEPQIIGSFPVHLHRASGTGEEAQCSICLSSVLEGDKMKVLPSCGHGFHVECIDEWLRAQTSCPLCRASLGESSQAAEQEVVA
ncbi:unnamed protein product [Musa acuminata subsp. malaccensis]|uniref:(wild Malaysian banana) hypothetical protein n=1 Tax=Musa acuminata subsp. malaccensis TaxID=214687 RepID=A0A804JAS9_MUSAM|nr:PREDICTED: RING-H2 finger protein ATL66-like [Musa acuminata subsp. malaccensis]CAG1840711.1 unnamed protein product [Musa acuminata subsp. malaccensis]